VPNPRPPRRRSKHSHELTPEERARGGRLRAANRWKHWYRQRWQEAVAQLRKREEELARVRRTVEHVSRSRSAAPSPPAVHASHARPGLSVAEQQAFELGLTGPPWWADEEALNARREARRRDRFRPV
jgi:hypothetical protein